jgi:hypothetical protein
LNLVRCCWCLYRAWSIIWSSCREAVSKAPLNFLGLESFKFFNFFNFYIHLFFEINKPIIVACFTQFCRDFPLISYSNIPQNTLICVDNGKKLEKTRIEITKKCVWTSVPNEIVFWRHWQKLDFLNDWEFGQQNEREKKMGINKKVKKSGIVWKYCN